MKDEIIDEISKKLGSVKVKSFWLKGITTQCKCEYHGCSANASWNTDDGKFCTKHAFEIGGAELTNKGDSVC